MTKPKNPQAFPVNYQGSGTHGMTLRDYFAGQALAGLLSREGFRENLMNTPEYQSETFASATSIIAYDYADTMLAERAK